MTLLTAEGASRVAALTIGIILRCGRFGFKRQADLTQVQTATDRASLALHKFLMPRGTKMANGEPYPEAARAAAKVFRRIVGMDRDAHHYLREVIGLPSRFMRGTHRVPVAAVADITYTLTSFKVDRQPFVDEFTALYPGLVEAMRGPLGAQWHAEDWPTVEEVRRGFSFEWQWFELDDVPKRLDALDPVAAASARAALQSGLEKVWEACRVALRSQAVAMVKEVAGKLAGGDDGEPKKFRQSTLLSDVHTFLKNIGLRDVTNDTDLQVVLSRLQALVAPLDKDTLDDVKGDLQYQAALRTQFDTIAADLDALMVGQSLRIIELED